MTMRQSTAHRAAIFSAIALTIAACHGHDPRFAESEVATLSDRQAIEQLVAGDYPHALDSRDWEGYANNFTDDGEVILAGRSAKGREQIIAFVSAVVDGAQVMHVITNLSYEINGNAATGQAYWQDVGMVREGVGILVAGHYEDTLRKVGDTWKIAKRSIVVDFIPERPRQ